VWFGPVLTPRPGRDGNILLSPRADALVSSATDGVARMSGRVALTERFAKSVGTGGRKSPIFYDDEVIDFGATGACRRPQDLHAGLIQSGHRSYFTGDCLVWLASAVRDEVKG
jgi:hypothetical protein